MQLGAKAEQQSLAHNGASVFCSANVQKLETEAKSEEPSPVCRGFSVPLANKPRELLEVRDELVGMQEHADGVLFCPQRDRTWKGFSRTAMVQQALGAELA